MNRPEKCVRRGCKEPRQEGSDLCAKHTRKYYGSHWRRYVSPQGDFGCGGGRRRPVVGDGDYGSDPYDPYNDHAEG